MKQVIRTCTSSMNITDACPPALLGPEPQSVVQVSPYEHAPCQTLSKRTEKHKEVGKIRYREAVVCFGTTFRLPIVGKSEASDTGYLQTWGQLSGKTVRKGRCASRKVGKHTSENPVPNISTSSGMTSPVLSSTPRGRKRPMASKVNVTFGRCRHFRYPGSTIRRLHPGAACIPTVFELSD